MRTEFEYCDGVVALPLARQKREQNLKEKQAREEQAFEQLEKIAALIEDAITRFLPETPGQTNCRSDAFLARNTVRNCSAHRRQRQRHRCFRRTDPILNQGERP